MRTETGVTGGSCQILVFFVSVVHSTSIPVLLAQTEIYQVNYFLFLFLSYHEILWFYITVDKIYWMQIFYTTYLLFNNYTSWSAIKQTVFKLNFLLHFSNNSSKFRPIRSKTITLYSLSWENQWIYGIPTFIFYLLLKLFYFLLIKVYIYLLLIKVKVFNILLTPIIN